jgi:small subunit ribosomal protein S8
MMSDIIADGLTRIRNASMRKLDKTTLIYSKMMVGVLDVLLEKGYVESYKVEEENSKQSINVVLKYDESGDSAISEITKISKPGRRIYKPANELKTFKNGFGTIVVSTNKGVIANDVAYKENVGGEVICSIW